MTEPHPWDATSGDGVHIWRTLGYRRGAEPAGGGVAIEWDATLEYTFPAGEKRIVHGGLITTLLDSAMGTVTIERVGWDSGFLTADLSVEFYRSALPGFLRAEAEIVHEARRAVFCSSRLFDADGTLLAAGRCTQFVRPRAT